jgi:glucose-6-phosphate isomerase
MPVNDAIIDELQKLADEQQLLEKYDAVLSGEMMNPGEKRLVLHHLTRGQILGDVIADGENLGEFYRTQLEHIAHSARRVRSGAIKGSTGKTFTTVCQIGIGGSDLGPARCISPSFRDTPQAKASSSWKRSSSATWILSTPPR